MITRAGLTCHEPACGAIAAQKNIQLTLCRTTRPDSVAREYRAGLVFCAVSAVGQDIGDGGSSVNKYFAQRTVACSVRQAPV